jgi:hypothetical protein
VFSSLCRSGSSLTLSAQPTNPYDQETQIRRLQIIFTEEEPEDWEAKKSGNVQDARGGKETRKSGAIL